MKRLEYFLQQLASADRSQCIVWPFGRCYGYGRVWTGVTTMQAHRLAWQIEHGDVPSGMLVCHSCDNNPCFNPTHLFLGTIGDNNHDRHRKKRDAKRENHGRAKLTQQQVFAIRQDLRVQHMIAAEYGITQGHVSRIKRGVLWTT